MTAPRVAPSILAADFGALRDQVAAVVAAGAQVIHVDVMDGHFVPPLTMGPPAVAALRDCGAHLDVHLMVQRPERHVEAFAAAGAHTITVHAEATPHVHRALQAVRDAGCRAGLALCPATPIAILGEVELDLALCMTVDPGWGGQAFIAGSPARIERIRALIGPDVDLEVDGGIDETTAGPCVRAGATLLVAGTAIFGADDPAEAFRRVQASTGAASRT
jgi:ribulose-phosphate 3-epimerase